MKLEKQVTSLEISKRLKELGVKQKSLFRYYGYPHGIILELNPDEYDCLSAFTVAELGEMLPTLVSSWKQTETTDGDIGFRVHYDDKKVKTCIADTEADARGKMLIYLLENKLITL